MSSIYCLSEEQCQIVEKKLLSLLETCQTLQIPMFATVVISNDEEETKYNRIVYSAQAHQMRLKNDQIRKHILISNGFDAVPARDAVEINMTQLLSTD